MTTEAQTQAEKTEKHGFQAEVSRLLHMMVHSVYSDRDIFLRELISNASDACDRLRYASQTDKTLLADGAELAITVSSDKEAGRLIVSDNGIGMNREDLMSHLGTIARSGTSAFMEKLTGDAKKDVSLIGQFGVGFYSVFMVADKVTVLSRKAGEEAAWSWQSDGLGEYSIAPAEKTGRGTDIIIELKEDAAEFLEDGRLRTIIKTYSDHIAIPISLVTDKEGAEETARINDGTALWARPKGDITEDQYKEFYHHVAHAFDEPWMTLHYRAEGVIEYSVLMFIPTDRPMDLFDPARRPRTKLYVKRVFITDDCEDLVPGYLRFMRGIVDSEDLPLNISREMLQNNPVMSKIKKALTNRILSELEKKADKAPEAYAAFWKNFGAVLKEGLYEDFERREQLLKLARFDSTADQGLSSLKDYVGRMKDGQDAIYYITGDDPERIKRSPQLEGFRSKGLEVLLLTDPVDDFWLQTVPEFDGRKLQSVTRGLADLDRDKAEKDAPDEPESRPELDALLAAFKAGLGDEVKDVRLSRRLTDSAVCLVADDGDMDMHLQRLLKAHNQIEQISSRVLEINPDHALIKGLAAQATADGAVDALKDAAFLLLDQARIMEGEVPADPVAFARRLSAVMKKGLDG